MFVSHIQLLDILEIDDGTSPDSGYRKNIFIPQLTRNKSLTLIELVGKRKLAPIRKIPVGVVLGSLNVHQGSGLYKIYLLGTLAANDNPLARATENGMQIFENLLRIKYRLILHLIGNKLFIINIPT